MKHFAELLDRLTYENSRNNKLRLMTDYFRSVPDPERGFALAALTGALSFQHAKPGVIRALIAERTDPVLFGLSHDYVGDLSETVALMWPTPDIISAERADNAGARARRQRSCRARPRRLHGRVEMGRHPRSGCRRAARGGHGLAALFAHRRGYFQKLPRLARVSQTPRRDRRRTFGRARGPGAELQCFAAAAQPQK